MPTAPVSSAPATRRSRQKSAGELGPKEYCWGTGRRKSSVARVRVRPGSGKILINKKDVTNYFSLEKDQTAVKAPLKATGNLEAYDVWVNANGGGTTGQAGAILMGLSRALIAADPATFQALRDGGFLTRDSRMVERKKYGQKKARKSFQFSKR
ncbi:MAG: 30S ribosomal protein S9 [Phycisphaerae bacterium]|nr:30S ribosomal protein S9 [Phycisphaerae bacterium]